MNWKGHTIFGIIFGLPFLGAPEQIFLLVAGALYPDLDHDVKSDIVDRGLYLAGGLTIISVLTYLFKPEYFDIGFFVGAVAVLLVYLIPNHSNHRGFTHTIYCMGIVSSILGFITYKLSALSPTLAGLLALVMITNNNLLGRVVPICVFVALLVHLIVSKIVLLNYDGMEFYIVPIALGYLSHIVGDSLTPAGVRPFAPLMDYKFEKKEAIIIMILWALTVFYLINEKINIL